MKLRMFGRALLQCLIVVMVLLSVLFTAAAPTDHTNRVISVQVDGGK